MDREEEMRIRRDAELRTLRRVHQRAKLMDESVSFDDAYYWGCGGREIIAMIGDLIRQAELYQG